VTDALPPPDPPPPDGESKLRRGLLRGVRAVFSSAGATIAAIAAGLALVFNAFPALVPDPRTSLAATMKVRSVEPQVRYDAYLERIFDDEPTADGDASGTVVNVQLNVAGRKHSGLRLYQYLHRLSDGRRLPDQPRVDALDAGFEADTPDDQWIQPVWVTLLGEQDVFARIELYDGDTMLAFVDTKDLEGPLH
jgi:hypothetical protein